MNLLSKPVLAVVGLTVGALCLWLAMRKVEWALVGSIIRSADMSFIAIGFALQGINLLMRAVRWRGILLFSQPARLGMVTEALLAGYAMNGALPARLGELFRAEYFARLNNIGMSGVLATIFVERLLDLMAALALLTVGIVLAGAGAVAVRDVALTGGAVAVAVAGLLWFVSSRLSHRNAEAWITALAIRLPKGGAIARALGPRLDKFAQAARVIGSLQFAVAAALTVPIWGVETVALWTMCRAVHVELDPVALACLIGGASLSTLLPTAPGFVGSYQYAYVLVLTGFGVSATSALVAASTAQIFLIGSYVLIGFMVLGLTTMIRTQRHRKVF
jgi:uncharacterized protein (TIRG00374 family)